MTELTAKQQVKQDYFKRLSNCFENYSRILVVGADNVGSHQFQKIRISLRGKAVVVMGKNTLIRKALRSGIIAKNQALEQLLPLVTGNIGFVFTNDDLGEVKKLISSLVVAAPARIGTVAPVDVIVPAGPTGMDPNMTSFLQALNISSKINKGQVEIISDVHLIKKGSKVGSSEASLLEKLKINPFSYGLGVLHVYDNGHMYSADVLDITDEIILTHFQAGVSNATALSLGAGVPTTLSVPHSIINGFKDVAALGLGTNFSFKLLDKLKGAAAQAASAPPKAEKGGDKGGKPEEKKAPEKKAPEPEPEEDADMGFGLFG